MKNRDFEITRLISAAAQINQGRDILTQMGLTGLADHASSVAQGIEDEINLLTKGKAFFERTAGQAGIGQSIEVYFLVTAYHIDKEYARNDLRQKRERSS